MARKTKAELEAEAKVARALAEKMAQDEYPSRLMNVLERASNLSFFEMDVRNANFRVVDRNARYDSEYMLPYSWTAEAQDVLENLTFKVEDVEEAQAEARRRSEVKKEAERKVREMLSDEERELLGL